MGKNRKRIIVAGDFTVDWLTIAPVEQKATASAASSFGWQYYPEMTMHAQFGGAFLIANILRARVTGAGGNPPREVIRYDLGENDDPRNVSPELVPHAQLLLSPTAEEDNAGGDYRVSRYLGFAGPAMGGMGIFGRWNTDNWELKYRNFEGQERNSGEMAAVVVLNDAGNGFAKLKEVGFNVKDPDEDVPGDAFESIWPRILGLANLKKLTPPGNGVDEPDSVPVFPPIVILKTRLWSGETPNGLWEYLQFCTQNGLLGDERLYAVIDANDLRRVGANISSGLSWERTIEQFLWEMENNSKLAETKKFTNLIVRFGVSGIAHFRANDSDDSLPYCSFYYDPTMVEGEYIRKYAGETGGRTSALCASLAADFSASGFDADDTKAVSNALKRGLAAARNLEDAGFRKFDKQVRIPYSFVLDQRIAKTHVFAGIDIGKGQTVVPPPQEAGNTRNNGTWSLTGEILEEKVKGQHAKKAAMAEIAKKVVLNGHIDEDFFGIPVARFGELQVVDRSEAEGYRSVRTLITEYLARPNASRPLSLAVFGQPGTGKSYGVREIAHELRQSKTVSIAENPLVFNLSEFAGKQELTSAFHRIRDLAVETQIPLVFFDEFDTGELCWLKSFLAPMQDGTFRDGPSIHPLGRAIFVFAGGTAHTFEDFSDQLSKLKTQHDEQNKILENQKNGDGKATLEQVWELRRQIAELEQKKLPDFVSRLSGYVNIAGLNKRLDADAADSKTANNSDDMSWILRRAIILRSIFVRDQSQLLDPSGKAQIDEAVLRALLNIPEYNHGVRSMEAIINMSSLSERTYFGRSFLPPRNQMSLHVDPEAFLNLVNIETRLYSLKGKYSVDLKTQTLQPLSQIISDKIGSFDTIAEILIMSVADLDWVSKRPNKNLENNIIEEIINDRINRIFKPGLVQLLDEIGIGNGEIERVSSIIVDKARNVIEKLLNDETEDSLFLEL